MNILERYIAKVILSAIFLVYIGLVLLFNFMSLVKITHYVGQGSFEFSDALLYILFTTPQITYDIFPFCALLGTLLGLNYLNSHSEITAIRCSGFSNLRIITSIIKISIPLSLFIFLLGEYIAPIAERTAINNKQTAINNSLTVNVKNEVWLKDKNYFANIKSIQANNMLSGLNIYTFHPDNQLDKIINAKQASFNGNNWILKDVKQTIIMPQELIVSQQDSLLWKTSIDLSFIEIITSRIKHLSAQELYQYALYLEKNNLDNSIYYLHFWQKIAAPFTLFVMLLIAFPFAATHSRSSNMGTLMVTGILIGISFTILNKISAQFGLLYHIPPFISAFTFTFLTFFISIALIKRLS